MIIDVDMEPTVNDSIVVEGLTFSKAFDIIGGKVTNKEHDLVYSVGGVYVAVLDDKILYIGSYSDTLRHRWFNVGIRKDCKREFRHDKGLKVSELANEKQQKATVYALPLKQIHEMYGDHPFSNKLHVAIEAHLIDKIKPPLNIYLKRGKK